MNVGTDDDTAQFAVESIRRWWNDAGSAAYPGAGRLRIMPPRSARTAAAPAPGRPSLPRRPPAGGDHRLRLPARHLEWNKIEHRLFSYITMNWRGRRLTSHAVIVATIASTTMPPG